MRDFTSWFSKSRCSKGALSTSINKIRCEIPTYWAGNRFKSGAYTSWLEATPTVFTLAATYLSNLLNNKWERHLAAIFEYFEMNCYAARGQKMVIYK